MDPHDDMLRLLLTEPKAVQNIVLRRRDLHDIGRDHKTEYSRSCILNGKSAPSGALSHCYSRLSLETSSRLFRDCEVGSSVDRGSELRLRFRDLRNGDVSDHFDRYVLAIAHDDRRVGSLAIQKLCLLREEDIDLIVPLYVHGIGDNSITEVTDKS